MKDKLYRTWRNKVNEGERFYRLRRFLWRIRYAVFPFKKSISPSRVSTRNGVDFLDDLE